MRFDVITLFPEIFTPLLQSGVTRRAYASRAVDVRLWNPRDWAAGTYRRVDDRPFGGGPGMVMLAQPLHDCLHAIWQDRASSASTATQPSPPTAAPDQAPDKTPPHSGANAPVILFSPAGQPLRHEAVAHWAASQGAVLLCGRYEGLDQRFIDTHVTHQISLGDFVLSGGELAAMVLLDAIARLQPGVLGDADSHAQDSFNPALHGLLDCPHYTRPEVWAGQRVPDVLLGGNHAHIAQWRRAQSLQITQAQRPDLIEKARQAGHLTPADERTLRNTAPRPPKA